MTRDQAIAALRAHADVLRARGVSRLALFGSTARDEARPDSDVDVLIDVGDDVPFSLLDLAGIEGFLTDVLGRPAHVVMGRDTMKPGFRARAMADAVPVFPASGDITRETLGDLRT